MFAMFVIPQFRRDPQLLALHLAANLLQRVSNLMFIAVYGSTVEVPVSNCGGTFHGSGDRAGCDVV